MSEATSFCAIILLLQSTFLQDYEMMVSGFIITTLIAFISLYLYFKRENKLQSDEGINITKRVHCPSCHKTMPIMRAPKNEYQRMFGGWTCKQCGTMMNKWGKEVDEEGNLIKTHE